MKVRETFGPCQSLLVDEAHVSTQTLIGFIPEDVHCKELQTSLKTNTSEEFGHGIKFSFPDILESSDLSEDSDSDNEIRFSLEINVEKWQSKDAGLYSNDVQSEANETHDNSKQQILDVSWLRGKCDLYFSSASEDVNSTDMCSVIFDVLSSPRADEVIQNELFELLGFDRFEFIQELLANRHSIVVGTIKGADVGNGRCCWCS